MKQTRPQKLLRSLCAEALGAFERNELSVAKEDPAAQAVEEERKALLIKVKSQLDALSAPPSPKD